MQKPVFGRHTGDDVGHEGPTAAGHVVAAFGGFLMGGDVVIGLILSSAFSAISFRVVSTSLYSPITQSKGAFTGEAPWAKYSVPP